MYEPHQIDKDFVVLDADKNASIEPNDSSLYERIQNNYKGFKNCELIASYSFGSDWDSWEIHPNGDEIVILLSGAVTFILETEAGERAVHLSEPGSYTIVPRNTWHTAKTQVSTHMLFITPGEGTRHKSA